MDWKLLATTFASIFAAEMGDKTQLATFALAGGTSAKWSVFAGSALALVASAAIAVLAGGWVSRHVSPLWLQRIAGAIFVVLGLWFLLAKGAEAAPPAPESAASEETEIRDR